LHPYQPPRPSKLTSYSSTTAELELKKAKNTQVGGNQIPHINLGKGATLVPGVVKLLHQELELTLR